MYAPPQAYGTTSYVTYGQPYVAAPVYAAPVYEQQPYMGAYAAKPMVAQPKRRHVNVTAVLISTMVPWLLFTFVFTVLSFSVHYNSPELTNLLVWLCLGIVILLGYFAYAALKKKWQGEGTNPTWYIFVFVTSFIAWAAACSYGSYNFAQNMQPYFDLNAMNVYQSVDPSQFKGQQLMDMGRVVFTDDTKLDLTKSMGFRNQDMYCVAPIVSGNGTMPQYDLWAVGTNCCSGHAADFACGEFNNPSAHSGLRLMRDDLRPYFRLAVQQAQAAYDIQATHPVFVQWMQDPMAEVNAYQDEGYKQYLIGVFLYFTVQVFFVVAATVAFVKAGK